MESWVVAKPNWITKLHKLPRFRWHGDMARKNSMTCQVVPRRGALAVFEVLKFKAWMLVVRFFRSCSIVVSWYSSLSEGTQILTTKNIWADFSYCLVSQIDQGHAVGTSLDSICGFQWSDDTTGRSLGGLRYMYLKGFCALLMEQATYIYLWCRVERDRHPLYQFRWWS